MAGELPNHVLKDPTDLRDQFYRPTLQPLPPTLTPSTALLDLLKEGKALFPRDQRNSPSCAGQALAALIDIERLRGGGRFEPASAWMLYRMAAEAEGVADDEAAGVSLRSVIKACYHHGCCSDSAWPGTSSDKVLTPERGRDARGVSLGAYYRVAPVLNDWHAALAEVGVVLASATLHAGWDKPMPADDNAYDIIKSQSGASASGHVGHAFLVVGYTEEGFIILNSWGRDWARWRGAPGLCVWSYADWAVSVMDAWVLRLGIPTPNAVEFSVGQQGLAYFGPVAAHSGTPARQLVGHFAHLEGGDFVRCGTYASNPLSVAETCKLLRDRKTEASAKAYRGVVLRLDGALHDLKAAVDWAVASKEDYKTRLRLYPFDIFWCPAAVPPFRAAMAACEAEACRRWAEPGERRDRLIEATSHAAMRAFWRDITEEARASAERAFASVLGQFLALEDHELRIQTFGEGALLLCRWEQAVGPQTRAAFCRRLRSIDMVAPPLELRDFEKFLLPLAQAIREAEEQDGLARRFRLHVPAEALRNRLRSGNYSGSYLQLIARACLRLSEGERLVGDDARTQWPDIEVIEIPDPAVSSGRTDRGALSQEDLVHGGALSQHLFRLLDQECGEIGQR